MTCAYCHKEIYGGFQQFVTVEENGKRKTYHGDCYDSLCGERLLAEYGKPKKERKPRPKILVDTTTFRRSPSPVRFNPKSGQRGSSGGRGL